MTNMRTMMAAVSNVLNRSGLSGFAGMTFEGKRDLYKVLGYERNISVERYRARYRRGGIAARVMEAKPNATWGRGPVIVEDENPDITTEFEQAILDLNARLNLWTILRRADILAGVGRFGVVLIGAPGDFKDPLETASLEDILYLTPWSEQDVGIDLWDDDTQSPRFGQPISYNFSRMTSNVRQEPRKVHWTRVLHIADGILDEQVLGTPRYEKVWNLFDDLEKVTGGGAEAFWLRVHPGFQLDVDKDTEMDEVDMAKLQKEAEEYAHEMRRFVRTRGTKMNILNAAVSGFSNQADAILTQISGASEIPKRILVGSESAHLASTQDRTNWHDRIDERRAQYAEPQIIRQLIDRFIEIGALKAVDEYNVRWPVIQNLDETEQAEVADKLAGLNSQIGGTVVTAAEIRDRVLQLPPLPEGEEEEFEEEEETEELEEELEEEEDGVEPETLAAPDSQPWHNVHGAADRHRTKFAKAFIAAVKTAKRETTIRELESLLKRNDEEGLNNITNLILNTFRKEIALTIPDLILATMNSGGSAAASTAKVEESLTTAQLVLAFDVKDPLAVAWATEHSAALVVGITETTRQAIRDTIAFGLDEGIAPRVTARALKNVIGLIPRDATRVVLESPHLSDKQLASLSNRLLRARAINIARTETIAAANEGQRQLWLQARSNGLITNEQRRWIVTPDDRLCEICEPMDGQVTALEGVFETGDGDSVIGPPAHPSCRCAVGLVTASEKGTKVA